MRLFEQVQVAIGGASRVLDARPDGDAGTLRLPAGMSYERLDPEDPAPGSVAADGLLVGVVPSHRPGTQGSPDERLDGLLGALAPGGRALLLVRAAPEDLPVSVIAGALGRCACQATAVLPAETVPGHTGLVVQRADEALTAGTYLEGGWGEGGTAYGEPADTAYVRRALNELVLTRFAARGWSRRWRETEEHRARLETALTQASAALQQQATARSGREQALLDQVAGLRDELTRLRSSASFQAARAVADAVHDPLHSVPRLHRTAAHLIRRYRSRRCGDGRG